MSKDIYDEGAWIFLSHSNKDFDKVRRVRNEFEKIGHRPLMFFLKCIDDESELEDLIKREIKAREIFMLCYSDNTDHSEWVRKEMEMINNLKGRTIEEVHLEDGWEKQLEKIHALSKRVSVFISYSVRDKRIAKAIADSLKEHDYGVFDPHSMELEEKEVNIFDQLGKTIKEAVDKGFFLILISPEAMRKSKWVNYEIKVATTLALGNIKDGSNIIPIIVDGSEDDLPNVTSLLRNVQYFDFTRGQFDTNMAELIDYLKTVKI